jgi:hypothetical protein
VSEHTPGPWMALPPASWEGQDGEWIVRSVARCGRGEFSEANARLIAAAPDLLAAAKEAYEHAGLHTADCERVTTYEEGAIFEDTTGCTCFLSRLRAAIAKAEPASPKQPGPK